MNQIDVSYRYSPKALKGGKMMMDPNTGIETLVLPEPEVEMVPIHPPKPAPLEHGPVIKPKAGKHGA